MTKKAIDLSSQKVLAVGNTKTYTLTDKDHRTYSAFMMLTADTVTVSNGVDSISLVVAINEEVPLGGDYTTIISTLDNTLVFLY